MKSSERSRVSAPRQFFQGVIIMASRIICPDCESVLRPAKPVPDGKRVKCPRCGGVFTAPGIGNEDEERPRKSKPSNRPAKTGKKKAAVKKEEPPIKFKDDDEEGGGGVYSFANVTESENEEKPDITYAPDTSIKDLRGPAQELVVRPSNWLILLGGLSCIGSIFMVAFMLWPFGFSDHLLDHKDILYRYYSEKANTDKAAQSRLKNLPEERKDMRDKEKEVVEDEESAESDWRLLWAGGFFGTLIYGAVLILGAVKVQNLESRRWGIASAVMMLLPAGTGGLVGVIYTVFYYTIAAFLFEGDTENRMIYTSVVAGLAYLGGLVVAIWSLTAFMNKKVISGFEYVAD